MARKSTRAPLGRVFHRKGRKGLYIRIRYKGKEMERFAGYDGRTAAEFLAKITRTLTREDLLGERTLEAITFAEFRPILQQALRALHAPSTIASENGRIERASVWFGLTPLKDIGPGEIQDFLTHLRTDEGLTAAASNRYAAMLSVAFRLAVQKGYARKNPVKDIVRPREAQLAVPFVSAEDVAKLISYARDLHLAALIRVLADTGLRRSEALALEWRDVDLRRNCLTVRESKNKRPRQVELTAKAHAAFLWLKEHRSATPMSGPDLVWPEWADKTPGAVSSRFKTVAKAAGLKTLRLHDLRHAFCSRLAQAGVPLATIGALAGHTSMLTTQRYASHLPSGATRSAIGALDQKESASVEKRDAAS